MENTKSNNSKKKEQGALWLKKSKQGNEFLSGYFLDENDEKVSIVVFKNGYKKPGESSPDYRIYLSNMEEGAGSKSQGKNASVSTPESRSPSEEADSEEIPF